MPFRDTLGVPLWFLTLDLRLIFWLEILSKKNPPCRRVERLGIALGAVSSLLHVLLVSLTSGNPAGLTFRR